MNTLNNGFANTETVLAIARQERSKALARLIRSFFKAVTGQHKAPTSERLNSVSKATVSAANSNEIKKRQLAA